MLLFSLRFPDSHPASVATKSPDTAIPKMDSKNLTEKIAALKERKTRHEGMLKELERTGQSASSVGETLRVVRCNSRSPSRLSRRRMIWLSAGWDMPNRTARARERTLLGDRQESRQIGHLIIGLGAGKGERAHGAVCWPGRIAEGDEPLRWGRSGRCGSFQRSVG